MKLTKLLALGFLFFFCSVYLTDLIFYICSFFYTITYYYIDFFKIFLSLLFSLICGTLIFIHFIKNSFSKRDLGIFLGTITALNIISLLTFTKWALAGGYLGILNIIFANIAILALSYLFAYLWNKPNIKIKAALICLLYTTITYLLLSNVVFIDSLPELPALIIFLINPTKIIMFIFFRFYELYFLDFIIFYLYNLLLIFSINKGYRFIKSSPTPLSKIIRIFFILLAFVIYFISITSLIILTLGGL